MLHGACKAADLIVHQQAANLPLYLPGNLGLSSGLGLHWMRASSEGHCTGRNTSNSRMLTMQDTSSLPRLCPLQLGMHFGCLHCCRVHSLAPPAAFTGRECLHCADGGDPFSNPSMFIL